MCGKNQQKPKWQAEAKTIGASNKTELSQGQKPRLQCWGCGELHYYKNCSHYTRTKPVNNVQEAQTVREVSRSMPIINVVLEDRQAEYQPTMVELEGKITNQPASILVDLGASLSYIGPKIVEKCCL